jgi:hypothetical protein
MEEHIKANAELVLQQLRQLRGVDSGYTQESVEWLEGYIERLRQSAEVGDDETKNTLISVFGSFLGECIARSYGGTWRQHEGVWCVAFNNDNMAFPFAKVAKQIDYGLEDGIASFFKAIPIVFEDVALAEPSTPNKPWWKVW